MDKCPTQSRRLESILSASATLGGLSAEGVRTFYDYDGGEVYFKTDRPEWRAFLSARRPTQEFAHAVACILAAPCN